MPITATLISQSEVELDPEHNPQGGKRIVYRVRIDDPDATLDPTSAYLWQFTGEGGSFDETYPQGPFKSHWDSCPQRPVPHGPWTTPTAKPGSSEVEMTYNTSTHNVLRVASDPCSFLAYPDSYSPGSNFSPEGAWFSPYASFAQWAVCIDEHRHLSLVFIKSGEPWTDQYLCPTPPITTTTEPSSTTG